jgi:hypothetical protein
MNSSRPPNPTLSVRSLLNVARLLKDAHVRRSPHPSSLRRTSKYASLLRVSGALHLGIFDQPEKNEFFNGLLRSDPLSLLPGLPDLPVEVIYSQKTEGGHSRFPVFKRILY